MAVKQGYSKKSAEQLQEELKQTLTAALPKIRLNEASLDDRLAFLDFMSRQYHYSPRNVALIRNQFEGAGFVASFNEWRQKGFPVRSGSHGIRIMAPVTGKLYKGPNSQKFQYPGNLSHEEKVLRKSHPDLFKVKEIRYYKLVSVFDISQTTAKPEDYPNIYPGRPFDHPTEHPEATDAIIQNLKEQAAAMGIQVTAPDSTAYRPLKMGAAKGVTIGSDKAREIVMKNNLPKTDYAAVLIHELAHAKLHYADSSATSKYWATTDRNSPGAREIREFQAELTSYVVCKSVGIDTLDEAKPYIADWTKNLKAVDGKPEQQQAALLSDVQRASNQIAGSLQESLAKGNEREAAPKQQNKQARPVEQERAQ